MIRIGVLGCGFIGTEICKSIDRGDISAELYAVYDTSIEKADRLCKSLCVQRPVLCSPEEMFRYVDLVVECASQEAAGNYVLDALKNDCDILVMSAGIFQNRKFHENALKTAQERNKRIYIPSGAIAGTDGLRSAMTASVYSVSIETRKPIEGLIDSPYVVDNNISLWDITKPLLLFEGRATEAVRLFPKNVNVCATVSLCGIGFEKTDVRIIADPTIDKNIHKLTVFGDFGQMCLEIQNNPSPTNPRTSYIAALSAISKIKEITSPIQIG